jgi:hypothetical protein
MRRLLLLLQQTACPLGVTPSKLITVEVSTAQRPVVRRPGFDRVTRARDRPAVPQGHVGDRVTGRILLGRQEDVGDSLIEEEVEIKTAPAHVKATRTAGSA